MATSIPFHVPRLLGGIAAGISKTVVAPVERVKLLLQTQHVNPDIASGLVRPYAGSWDCFVRLVSPPCLCQYAPD